MDLDYRMFVKSRDEALLNAYLKNDYDMFYLHLEKYNKPILNDFKNASDIAKRITILKMMANITSKEIAKYKKAVLRELKLLGLSSQLKWE